MSSDNIIVKISNADVFNITVADDIISVRVNSDDVIAVQLKSIDVAEKGIKGDKGDKGDPGLQGIQGIRGEKGDKGEMGVTGATGPKGDTGAAGATGLKGDTGAKGDTGETGQRGLQGDTGPQGIQGVKGDQGDRGLRGEDGSPGARGPQGDKGDTGSTGAQGIQGIQGETGADGINGVDGVKGDKGDAGAGVVAGGATGQILAKKTNDDYDTEWIDNSGGGASNFLALTDTPDDYTDHASHLVRVNCDATGLEFFASPYLADAPSDGQAYGRCDGSWVVVGGGSSYTFTRSVCNDGCTVHLVNDSDSPGGNKVYGTDGGGTKGWLDMWQGPQGPEGPQGPQGPQGDPGGPQGPEGPQGPQGPQGDPGSNGSNGNDGRVYEVHAGSNISVDNTDPANPVISGCGGGGGGIGEAPYTCQIYGRCNGTWVTIGSGGGGIGEAPNDNQCYVRCNSTWVVPSFNNYYYDYGTYYNCYVTNCYCGSTGVNIYIDWGYQGFYDSIYFFTGSGSSSGNYIYLGNGGGGGGCTVNNYYCNTYYNYSAGSWGYVQWSDGGGCFCADGNFYYDNSNARLTVVNYVCTQNYEFYGNGLRIFNDGWNMCFTDCTGTYRLCDLACSGGGCGGTSVHTSLSNLNWACAGHYFDTNLDLSWYNVCNVCDFEGRGIHLYAHTICYCCGHFNYDTETGNIDYCNVRYDLDLSSPISSWLTEWTPPSTNGCCSGSMEAYRWTTNIYETNNPYINSVWGQSNHLCVFGDCVCGSNPYDIYGYETWLYLTPSRFNTAIGHSIVMHYEPQWGGNVGYALKIGYENLNTNTGCAYGIYIDDHSCYNASGYNFYSAGACSRNAFEGSVQAGSYLSCSACVGLSGSYTVDCAGGTASITFTFESGLLVGVA